jgi:hypothetical protein
MLQHWTSGIDTAVVILLWRKRERRLNACESWCQYFRRQRNQPTAGSGSIPRFTSDWPLVALEIRHVLPVSQATHHRSRPAEASDARTACFTSDTYHIDTCGLAHVTSVCARPQNTRSVLARHGRIMTQLDRNVSAALWSIAKELRARHGILLKPRMFGCKSHSRKVQ